MSSPAKASSVRRLASERSIQLLIIAWVFATVATIVLADGRLPFDRPELRETPFAQQVGFGWLNLAGGPILAAVAFAVTRNRVVPDLAARLPGRAAATAEVALAIGYGGLVHLGGLALGRAIGDHAISLHLPGTLYGTSEPVSAGWAIAWMAYNLAFFAVVPYLWLRGRGFSHEQLGLRSSDHTNDALLIVTILAIESIFELTALGGPLFALDPGQALRGAIVSFVLNLFGTVLPIMAFVYVVLLPRYLRLTGSVATTVVLGGVTYAAMHLFEAWAVYDSPTNVVLTLIFLMFQYVPPGIVKSVRTLRTGNAWVHVWAYHAIAPHTHVDAPNAVDIFRVR